MSSLVESPEYQAAARFVELTLEKRALRERLKELEGQLKTLEPALVGYLSANSLPCFAVKDYLLSPYREPWIYPITGVSRQMVCEALKISGLHKMVTENYSTQSLTAHVKSLEEHHKLETGGLLPDSLDEVLPPVLARILNVVPAFSLRVQKKARSYTQQPEQTNIYEQETTSDENEE